MLYRFLADLVVITHFAFVAFVLGGGLLILWWRRIVWIHVPAALWGAVIEFSGWVCPLTPLENWLREKAGEIGYHSGFIEHYLIPVLYPAALTQRLQIFLGLVVLCVNLGIYSWVFRRPVRPGFPTSSTAK
jgi:hypothetical protein